MSSTTRPSRTSKPARSDYIETDSGNKVSRRAQIAGTPNITLAGKTVLMPDVLLRGDIVRSRHPPPPPPPSSSTADTKDATGGSSASSGAAAKEKTSTTAISIGKCSIIGTGTVLHPPCRQSRGTWTAYPLKIGDHVYIGEHCNIQAALIHSHVHVGARSVLMPFCVVRENVRILPGSVVPANMVIPPGVVVGGRPARILGEVGEGFGVDGCGEGWVEGGDLREVVRGIK